MTGTDEHAMTVGDKGFLEGLMQRTTAIYAARGGDQPVAYVEREDGRMAVLESNGLGNDAEKEIFLNLVRYHSVRCASRRSAIIAEGWAILGHDDETMMDVGRYVAAGNRVSKHPLAREYVTITVESDAGIVLQVMSIDRKVKDMAILVPEGGPRVMPWAESYESYGVLNNFHVRSVHRITPHVMQWAAQMDQHLGSAIRDGQVEDLPPRPAVN